MSESAILPGPPEIEVRLRRSRQARRMSLRVSRLDGRVTLSLPEGVRRPAAMAFLTEKEAWLRRALSQLPPGERVAPGGRVPVEGQILAVDAGPVRAVTRQGDALIVPRRDPARTGARVRAYLKHLAGQRLTAACDGHAARLGRGYGRLTLRDTRSRWGSCSERGNLNFSWRLVMAPRAVLDYVAAHEVAHLAEMNHSAAFWAHVARLVPDHAVQRDWLRRHGHELHGWRFED